VAHACNPGLRRLKQKDYMFKASLSYIVRPVSKNKERKKKKTPEIRNDFIRPPTLPAGVQVLN
jgi:hypothetical protein